MSSINRQYASCHSGNTSLAIIAQQKGRRRGGEREGRRQSVKKGGQGVRGEVRKARKERRKRKARGRRGEDKERWLRS